MWKMGSATKIRTAPSEFRAGTAVCKKMDSTMLESLLWETETVLYVKHQVPA